MSSEQEAGIIGLQRDLIFLILQYLDEEKYSETRHKLERESGCYFDIKYFKDLVLDGNWGEAERYFSSFAKLEDDNYCKKVFFELRKQKYLEALDRQDRATATAILVNELKVFAPFNEELYKEMTWLLTFNNIREHKQLVKYTNAANARTMLVTELEKLLNRCALIQDKLKFPKLEDSRLQMLINQSFFWQHKLCKNPVPDPQIKTLFVDHKCVQPNHLYARPGNSRRTYEPKSQFEGFFPVASSMPFSPVPVSYQNQPAVSKGLIDDPVNQVAHPRSLREYGNITSIKSSGITDRMMGPVTSFGESGGSVLDITEELPMTIVGTLNHGTCPKSMDFHPELPTLLLVGSDRGDIGLWEVGLRKKLVSLGFCIWNIGLVSTSLKSALVKDPWAEVKRTRWSPDGSLFGAAYSKHMLHIYSYFGQNNIQQHLEVEAHIGSVNDFAFADSSKLLSVVTCGEDKTIKVWDVANGACLFTFAGHEAPVYSVCHHVRDNIHFIFSNSIDGKIKAWLYDTSGGSISYDAPGGCRTTVAYSADGRRLFSCGTNQNGETHLVEWIESEGVIKRRYQGLYKCSSGIVHFDTSKNRFLVAGDNYVIKFWEMDNTNLLVALNAGEDLPETPCVRFNKEGTFLAVSTSNNKIKMLATVNGIRFLQAYELPVP